MAASPEPPLPFGGGRFLIDLSAYMRSDHSAVRADWEVAVRAGQIVVSSGFLIEVLYGATNAKTYEALKEELTAGFEQVEFDAETWSLALAAQGQLATVAPSYHRRPPIDLLIAAAAHQAELGVLHYDRDFDLIAEHTSLRFESRWIAEPGTL